MKTVRMLDFLQRAVVPELEARVVWRTSPRSLRDGYTNADLPFVLITSRINLAHKIEADLTKRGIGVHNYKNKPSEVKMEEWLNHPWVIISIEQLEKLESWVSTYQDGTVVFDEVVTGAMCCATQYRSSSQPRSRSAARRRCTLPSRLWGLRMLRPRNTSSGLTSQSYLTTSGAS